MIAAFEKLSDPMKIRAVQQLRDMLAQNPNNAFVRDRLDQLAPLCPEEEPPQEVLPPPPKATTIEVKTKPTAVTKPSPFVKPQLQINIPDTPQS